MSLPRSLSSTPIGERKYRKNIKKMDPRLHEDDSYSIEIYCCIMKKRILFDLKKEYYFNSFISIIKAFEGDKRFETAFHVGKDDERRWGIFPVYNKKRIEAWLRKDGYNVVSSPEGFDAVVAADAIRNPEKYGLPQLFISDHGLAIKTLRMRNIVRQTSRRYTVFVEGRYWMDIIKKFGFENSADWILSGLPKLDTLFWAKYYNREEVLRKLHLDPSKKTVLFAPSYRPSCIPFLKTSIAQIADHHNLIIKLHPYSWGGKYAPASQSRIYRMLVKRVKHIALIAKDEFDATPYIFAADTVLSDTSSTLPTCLALGRVGIVADFPYSRMKHSDGMPMCAEKPGEYLRGVFIHLREVSRLMDAVNQALYPSQEQMQKLLAYRDYYFTGLDGKAGERAKNYIVERLIGNNS